MSSLTGTTRSSSRMTGHLPNIDGSSDKPEFKNKKCSSAKALSSKINLPKLRARDNSVIRRSRSESTPFQEAQKAALLNSLWCVKNAQKLTEERNFKSCLNAVGPTECQLLFKVPSSEINFDLETQEEKFEESNALKRWEYWMNDKIRLQNHLSKCLERNPCDLLIQKPDKIRQLVEEKSLLEYSQIPEADKWRGHPYYWKPFVCLGKRKSLSCSFESSPKYCAIKSKAEEKEISEMEFIGIPRAIQNEKGLICNIPCKSGKSPMNLLERLAYRKERINYFMKQREKLKPHDIEMNDLEIVGVKISQGQEEAEKSFTSINVPEIEVMEDEEESRNCIDYRQSVFCLVIDGEEIKYEIGTKYSQDPDRAFTWQINFGVITVKSLVEKVLRVENKGTVAVKYDWLSKIIEQKQSLDSLLPTRREPWFFFDKNSGFFLPGQIYDLKFYFYANNAGVRKEVWYLRTKPPLSANQEITEIVLSAVATEELSDERNGLESYLRKRLRDSVVAFAIEILLYKVFKTSEGLHGIEYRSIFCEKDLFEYHNAKYYYHSTCVKTLKALFEEIPGKSQPEWDLSLNTLILLIKTNSGKEKNALLRQISEKAKKLLRPNYVSVKGIKKYKMTYEILCKMTNFVEEDYNYIRSLVSEKIEQNEEKAWSDEETEEFLSSLSLKSEEMSEASKKSSVLFEVKPRNFIFFRTMFYIKMYYRLCEAVEQVAGALYTRSLFQPHRQIEYKLEKPSQKNKNKCLENIL